MTAPRHRARLIPALAAVVDRVADELAHRPKTVSLFARCFTDAYVTNIRRLADGTTFVQSGDIPVMGLRDSAAQVRPYLIPAADDPELADLLVGVVRRQLRGILRDPYANAFDETGARERKYSVDSLCYPLQLAYLLWQATGRTDHLDDEYGQAAATVIALWRREQRHPITSAYRYHRRGGVSSGTLSRRGQGAPVAETGMTWSGFRPSDDPCRYGYHVPSNMFAVAALGHVEETAMKVLEDLDLVTAARSLAAAIDGGIRRHAVVDHARCGRIYAYEVDGLGHHHLMDDANVPSLVSAPYLGYCDRDDPLYLSTRAFALSAENPFYFGGRVGAGVGSQRMPWGFVSHLGLAMLGLTAIDEAEREALLDTFERTDGGAGVMHGGFDSDDPAGTTRLGFGRANALYSEFVLSCCGVGT